MSLHFTLSIYKLLPFFIPGGGSYMNVNPSLALSSPNNALSKKHA